MVSLNGTTGAFWRGAFLASERINDVAGPLKTLGEAHTAETIDAARIRWKSECDRPEGRLTHLGGAARCRWTFVLTCSHPPRGPERTISMRQ